jgi:hypothetical protein
MMRFSISIVAATAGSNTPLPGSGVVLNLTDLAGSFTNVEFSVVPVAQREILAVALAAISTQSKVEATLDPPGPGVTSPNCYALSILPS